MPLAAGTRIGGYDIVALIGAGGMGEVYRARDARLGRDVAIKVVSPSIAADADGLMRFEREARILASLSHPNIAAIYGVEDHAGVPALVLELVEGETLADRIARGRVAVGESLQIARQLTDALDAAHEAGVVHRDLKPGNIKITDAGIVKVLDFGLAKAIAAATGPDPAVDPAHSPTVTVKGTQGNVILGTVAYMSPEQARGKAIDKRTDIWAFGCVLYEMLTARRAFDGDTTSDVIAAVIERQPDWTQLPAATPAHLRRVMTRCLEKDPRRRARDIAEVALQLEPGAEASTRPSRLLPWPGIAAAAILIATAAALAAWRWNASTPAAAPEAVEFSLSPPANHTFAGTPAVSPNGRLIALLARDANRVASVWIRPLDGGATRRLEGTEGVAGIPIWSPDSRALAFVVGEAWKRIDVEGGPLLTVVSDVVADMGASWGTDERILVSLANRTGLSRVPAAGGAVETVTALDVAKENSHRFPQLLPDGRHFLFTVRSDRPENLGIKIGAFGSQAVRLLVAAPSPARFAEPGWLLFITPDEVLMAQRLEPGTWILSGSPQPIAASVRYNGPSFYGAFDVSRDGRVLTYTPAAQTQGTLAWFDRSGKPLGTVGPERRYRSIRLSPDGRRAAVELADDRYGTRDVWLLDIGTNALTRLTANTATDWRPVFSPDGTTLAFASDRAGSSTVFRTAVDGSGGETVLYRNPDGGAFPSDWSRDGKHILVQLEDSKGRRTGFVSVPVDGGPASPIFAKGEPEMTGGRYSPEGDRVAFSSNVTGSPEVYVLSLADRGRVRVSPDGGIGPVWGRNGGELYYVDQRGAIMLAALDSGAEMVRARPAVAMRPCVTLNRVFAPITAEPGFDVAADGARILVRCDSADAIPSSHTVVVNWQSRLR